MIRGTYRKLVVSDQNPCSNGKSGPYWKSSRDSLDKNRIQVSGKIISQVLSGNYLAPYLGQTWIEIHMALSTVLESGITPSIINE